MNIIQLFSSLAAALLVVGYAAIARMWWRQLRLLNPHAPRWQLAMLATGWPYCEFNAETYMGPLNARRR